MFTLAKEINYYLFDEVQLQKHHCWNKHYNTIQYTFFVYNWVLVLNFAYSFLRRILWMLLTPPWWQNLSFILGFQSCTSQQILVQPNCDGLDVGPFMLLINRMPSWTNKPETHKFLVLSWNRMTVSRSYKVFVCSDVWGGRMLWFWRRGDWPIGIRDKRIWKKPIEIRHESGSFSWATCYNITSHFSVFSVK